MQNSHASDTTAASEDEGRDVEVLQTELTRMEDRFKRALADLDNYRKRSAGEADRRIAEAGDRQLLEWLEVVDSIERALVMSPDPVDEGLRAVLEQMEAILARQGVQRIGAVGERFDPARHEAIGVQSADGDTPDQTVVSVPRAGYLRDGRVLRPAQVIVARASPE